MSHPPHPLTELRLAQLTHLEPRPPMPPRLKATDGGAYAWTDDADLYPSVTGAVVMSRPNMPAVVLWRPSVPPCPTAAQVVEAILRAIDAGDTWGVVDVAEVVAGLEVSP